MGESKKETDFSEMREKLPASLKLQNFLMRAKKKFILLSRN